MPLDAERARDRPGRVHFERVPLAVEDGQRGELEAVGLRHRGGGFVVTGRSLNDAVSISVYIPRNARVITMAKSFGRMVGLSKGESAARIALDPDSNAMRRGWEYWARQAGCADLLAD